MRETNKQQGGDHYRRCGIEPVEYIHANNLDFFRGNVVKYVTRDKDKNGAEDILKAIDYLNMILEFDYGVTHNEVPIVEDYDTYFKGVDRIKEGSDCIAVLKARVACGAVTADATIVSLDTGEPVAWEAYEVNGDLRLKRQDGSTVFLRQENANLFDVVGIAKEADLKKKGLTQRQINELLSK